MGAGVASCMQPAADPAPAQAAERPFEPLTTSGASASVRRPCRSTRMSGRIPRFERPVPHIAGGAADTEAYSRRPDLGGVITHACAFRGAPTPLVDHDLQRRDVDRLTSYLWHLSGGILARQKVVLEGVLRPMPGGAATAGSWDTRSTAMIRVPVHCGRGRGRRRLNREPGRGCHHVPDEGQRPFSHRRENRLYR